MSIGFNSNIQLGLSAVNNDAIKAELAMAVNPLYYALHNLHRGVSMATGDWNPSTAEFSTIAAGSQMSAGRHRKHYAIASVLITAGSLVYVLASGQMALATAATAASLAIGYATQTTAAGAWGEFILFEGAVAATGATPGNIYYLSNTAGAFSLAAGTVVQKVGICLTPNLIYLRISL